MAALLGRTGQHRAAQRACERVGGLAMLQQSVHRDLAALSTNSHSAAAASAA